MLHGVNDAYTAFLPPLLPRIMGKLDLSITLAATLMMTLSLAASLAQPALGHLADRFGRRTLVVAGPILSGVFLSCMGLAPSFAILMALLVAGGLGSAAFHPPGASIAVRAGEGRGSGMRHAVFSFGGAVGLAVGPVAAVGLVAWVGLEGMWVAMVPAILIAVAFWPLLPSGTPRALGAPSPSIRRLPELLVGPVGLVFAISAASAFLQRLFLTMEPIVIAEAGGTEAAGAVVLSVYLAGQAGGTLLGGFLADRIDRRWLIAGLAALSFPAHVGAIALAGGGATTLAFAAAAGLVNQAILTPVVVIALEVAGESAAMGGGVVMGLAWAAGSIGVLGAGILGDAVGARPAALALTPVILAACWLALRPGLREHHRPPAT
ncbi:MAG: MFS transporter [Gemmatimonadota bacterium]|nr:MFS transporter [Gemmatimonadota bacterium]